ncbi:hypothetical protein BLOT_001590 [Blomia tropicalis]|nr:hypothetical protein BLOT_001590 [Blomia tropicalis]
MKVLVDGGAWLAALVEAIDDYVFEGRPVVPLYTQTSSPSSPPIRPVGLVETRQHMRQEGKGILFYQ